MGVKHGVCTLPVTEGAVQKRDVLEGGEGEDVPQNRAGNVEETVRWDNFGHLIFVKVQLPP